MYHSGKINVIFSQFHYLKDKGGSELNELD